MNRENKSSDLESTAKLLGLARNGDDTARDRLLHRYLPILQRWARGRLPAYARDLTETSDLVQTTVIRSLKHLDRFESRGEGAFLAYLRQILLNSVRDEIRRVSRRPGHDPLPERIVDQGQSVLHQLIGQQRLERYEASLEQLEDRQKQAVVLRLEFGYSFSQVAEAIDAPSANAARMVVSRAMVRLSESLSAS